MNDRIIKCSCKQGDCKLSICITNNAGYAKLRLISRGYTDAIVFLNKENIEKLIEDLNKVLTELNKEKE